MNDNNVKVRSTSKRTAKRRREIYVRNIFILIGCMLTVIMISVISRLVTDGEKGKVYAANDEQILAENTETLNDSLPSGIAGFVSGVNNTPAAGSRINHVGSSAEQVMVGQRVSTVRDQVTEFDISGNMVQKVSELDSISIADTESAKLMTDTDYETLLAIVEAEAGTEDVKGKALIANVIMNRVKNEEYPNSITEVVYQYVDGVPQFSPVYDGRIYSVTISDETKEAVKQVLEGTDYSEGALFFIQKSAAEKHNVSWFEKDLQKLFKYGVHEFYKYPDKQKSDSKEKKEKEESASEDNIVQMVKNDTH
ncbi:MAG: cell wall hydrolase [Eubacteriales bacterium]|nr:cell wall hydrolase [Eubacteriales bacterium]